MIDSAALRDPALLEELTDLARQAAFVIESIRSGPVLVKHKPDASPLTAADEESHELIVAGLARVLPGLPVVSEESADGARPDTSGIFALVDPLDGTREFIAGNGEFTVNIALIDGGRPIMGVVAAPALGLIWRGIEGWGAERVHFGAGTREVQRIRARDWPGEKAIALVSRSHLDAGSERLLEAMGITDRQSCGSAVKFCRLAEGSADFYPRLATTCEWDVAAAHAVLAAAGGAVVDAAGNELHYGNGGGAFRVPSFIAAGDPAAAAKAATLVAAQGVS